MANCETVEIDKLVDIEGAGVGATSDEDANKAFNDAADAVMPDQIAAATKAAADFECPKGCRKAGTMIFHPKVFTTGFETELGVPRSTKITGKAGATAVIFCR